MPSIDRLQALDVYGNLMPFPSELLKQATLSLSGAAIHAAVQAWQNPEQVPIIITRVILDLTTVATAAATLDIGTTATSATTLSDNLIDGPDVHTAAGLFDNINDAGTNGLAKVKLAVGKWLTVAEASGNATGLVGTLYIHYVLAG